MVLVGFYFLKKYAAKISVFLLSTIISAKKYTLPATFSIEMINLCQKYDFKRHL